MKRILLAGVVTAAALLAIVTVLNLPPRALSTTASSLQSKTWPVARGAFHVHSQRSDGTGTLDDIAAAAAAAGLQFVIMTDHGDGTRAPEPPTYRSGVLCIDGVEISTSAGHYAAIDLPRTPYPLAGEPRAVIEDVHRFGGFGFAAHPGSPKPALEWRDWEAPFDGLEWLNADSEWRDELWGSIGVTLLTYPLRPVETLGAMLDRPARVMAEWNRLVLQRRVAAIAAADAHARLGYREAVDPYEERVIARLPSYEVSFRAFVNHAVLDTAMTGDAGADAKLITSAIREGRVFSSIDSLAVLSGFEFKAVNGDAAARPGEYLDNATAVALEAAIDGPDGTSLAVFRNGELLYETREPALRIDIGTEPGAYRVEALLPSQTRSSVPWVLTNPIYVGLRESHLRSATAAVPPASTRASVATEMGTPEASRGSTSELRGISLEDGTPAIEWAFSLAPGARGAQFAAIRFPLGSEFGAHDRLQLRARSDRPRRLWAQLRASRSGERWGRSFYVGPELTSIDLRFAGFKALDTKSGDAPPSDGIDSLLLVIDTVNTAPGSTGRIAFTDLWLAR